MTPLETITGIQKPCNDAAEWLSTQPDLATAWETCERGDWLLWLIKQSKIANKLNGRTFAFMALEFAQLCAKPDEDPRITTCRAVTRKYLDGEASLSDLESTAASAESAWLESESAAAWSAAASAAAAWSARSARSASAESASWRQQAEIVRKHFTFAEVLEACNVPTI